MKERRILIGILALGLLLALAVGLSQAQGPEPPEGDANRVSEVDEAAAVGSRIPVQGRLTDASGNPLSGTYSIRFGLYDAATGGTALCEDTNSVSVENGLFYSEIWGDCGSDEMNGQQLYLGIKVGADDEMSDRQAIYPVPYAFSLKPGADISGTIGSDAVVHAENWATNGRGLRGWARAASGVNYGVIAGSWSPDGYGGYFDNDGGGYALGVEGGMRMTVNAGYAKPIDVGDRYRDNAIIAWAMVSSNGAVGWEFGVASVTRAGAGNYMIELDAHAAGVTALIPIAIAEVETQPDSAAEVRIVSINQTADNIFRIYINDGNWNVVDNDFVFVVTGR